MRRYAGPTDFRDRLAAIWDHHVGQLHRVRQLGPQRGRVQSAVPYIRQASLRPDACLAGTDAAGMGAAKRTVSARGAATRGRIHSQGRGRGWLQRLLRLITAERADRGAADSRFSQRALRRRAAPLHGSDPEPGAAGDDPGLARSRAQHRFVRSEWSSCGRRVAPSLPVLAASAAPTGRGVRLRQVLRGSGHHPRAFQIRARSNGLSSRPARRQRLRGLARDGPWQAARNGGQPRRCICQVGSEAQLRCRILDSRPRGPGAAGRRDDRCAAGYRISRGLLGACWISRP